MTVMNITYRGDLRCEAVHSASGTKLETDAPVDNGGKGESFSPTDLVATGLGCCMVTIMGIVAKRDGIPIEGTTVQVTKHMAQQPVRRIRELEVVINVAGGSKLNEELRKKLERAALTCPVHQSLHPEITVPVTFQWT